MTQYRLSDDIVVRKDGDFWLIEQEGGKFQVSLTAGEISTLARLFHEPIALTVEQ